MKILRESKVCKKLSEDWYGADSEVEFETSVYPAIAKYFGLKDGEVVTYAYYFLDEVIVQYDDATGRPREIEKHVPLDQVEEWFKAGYTILNEAGDGSGLTAATSVPDVAYVVKFDDGIGYEDVYLTFSDKVDDYISVDYIDEVGAWDYHTDVKSALDRARDFGGTDANLRIVKVNNFKDAYLNGADPDEELVQIDAQGVGQLEQLSKNTTTPMEESYITEARSVAEIKAQIHALMRELRDAERAERAGTVTSTSTAIPTTSVSRTKPTSVWTWDIYLTPKKKGTWTGIQNDLVFETQDKALDAAWALLNELDDEGELRGDPDDYYVEAFEIPLSSVSKEALKFSNLAHLI